MSLAFLYISLLLLAILCGKIHQDDIQRNEELKQQYEKTRESNIKLWTILRFDPPRWDVWDAPELLAPDPYFGNESVFKVLLDVKDEIVSPNNKLLSAAAQDLVRSQVMYKVLVERSQTPADALKKAADELRKRK